MYYEATILNVYAMKYYYNCKKIILWLLQLIICYASISCTTKRVPLPTDEGEEQNIRQPMAMTIFILNGLWQEVNTFDHFINNLSTSLEKASIAVKIKKLEENLTSAKPIYEQAATAYERMQQVVQARHESVVLIGHSQGGLRGAAIVQLNEAQGRLLDIRALITLSTPWEGAPAAALTKERVQAILQKRSFSYCLAGASYICPPARQITGELIGNLFDQYCPTHGQGVQDMVPKSDFLTNLTANLLDIEIPVFAIGGANDNVHSFLPHEPSTAYIKYIKKIPAHFFNLFYRRLITNSWQGSHDMMVPLASQLATNTPKKNIFETCLIIDAVHDFLPGLTIPIEKVIYNHPQINKEITCFIQNIYK